MAIEGVRSRASDLIANCPDSHAEIADKLGVDKSLVTRWKSGARKPSDEQLAALERLYGREEEAPPPPPFPDEPEPVEAASRPRLPSVTRERSGDDEDRDESNTDRLHRFIRDGMTELELDTELSGVKRAEALKKLADAQVALDRSTGANALTLHRIVAHPEFKRCVKIIVEAIAPFPEALQAATKALESVSA